MIISKICGGLGNQMFQYAAGRALAMKHNVPLLLDLSWFSNMKDCTPRKFMLEGFPALASSKGIWRSCSDTEKYTLCHVPFWQRVQARLSRNQAANPRHLRENLLQIKIWELKTSPPLYLDGYWQDERCFVDIKIQIRDDFVFPHLSDEARCFACEITSERHAVSVHIRRGDYASNAVIRSYHGLCTAEYYAAALTTVKEAVHQPTLFLFSDDIAWVRSHFDPCGLRAVIVESQGASAEFDDMHLMSLCRHHILANSSFSWWGTWLASQEGITIAPKAWFAEPQRRNDNPCPLRWVRI